MYQPRVRTALLFLLILSLAGAPSLATDEKVMAIVEAASSGVPWLSLKTEDKTARVPQPGSGEASVGPGESIYSERHKSHEDADRRLRRRRNCPISLRHPSNTPSSRTRSSPRHTSPTCHTVRETPHLARFPTPSVTAKTNGPAASSGVLTGIRPLVDEDTQTCVEYGCINGQLR